MLRSTVRLALVACFILVGYVLDNRHQRSTPGAIHTQGTFVAFRAEHATGLPNI
jgi:hypothetical protein